MRPSSLGRLRSIPAKLKDLAAGSRNCQLAEALRHSYLCAAPVQITSSGFCEPAGARVHAAETSGQPSTSLEPSLPQRCTPSWRTGNNRTYPGSLAPGHCQDVILGSPTTLCNSGSRATWLLAANNRDDPNVVQLAQRPAALLPHPRQLTARNGVSSNEAASGSLSDVRRWYGRQMSSIAPSTDEGTLLSEVHTGALHEDTGVVAAKRYGRSTDREAAERGLAKLAGVAFPDGNLVSDEVRGGQDAGKVALEESSEPVEGVIPEVWGRVHSIESFSAVDGPGVRSVIFLQGCLRRCVFCANPDTWSYTATCQRLSSKSIAAKLKRNLLYYEGGGGVTISGGEPMMQPHFCGAVFKEAHRLGITTALDTAGYGHSKDWADVLPHTDTVLMCTKAMDPKMYFKLVEVKQQIMLDFAKAVADYGVPLVIRFVLIPGYTDTKEEIEALVKWAKAQPTLVGIEMLPYHRLGVNKWEALGLKYPLEGMDPPSKETVNFWRSYITAQGIQVML